MSESELLLCHSFAVDMFASRCLIATMSRHISVRQLSWAKCGHNNRCYRGHRGRVPQVAEGDFLSCCFSTSDTSGQVFPMSIALVHSKSLEFRFVATRWMSNGSEAKVVAKPLSSRSTESHGAAAAATVSIVECLLAKQPIRPDQETARNPTTTTILIHSVALIFKFDDMYGACHTSRADDECEL